MSDRQIANLQRRVRTFEKILRELLSENTLQLAGGTAFAQSAIEQMEDANDF